MTVHCVVLWRVCRRWRPECLNGSNFTTFAISPKKEAEKLKDKQPNYGEPPSERSELSFRYISIDDQQHRIGRMGFNSI